MSFKDRIKDLPQRVNTSPWAAGIFILVLLIPIVILWISCLPFTDGDLNITIMTWIGFMESHGYWRALAYPFANYSPAYLYVLMIIAYMENVPMEIYVKVFSIILDIGMACLTYQIVKQKYKTRFYPILAAITLLASPVVWMDSALWGQCDSFYTFFLLGFIWLMSKDKPVWAMVSFALAFALKPQPIFIAPFIGVLVFRRKIPWWTLFLVPAVYILFALPAWYAGRPFIDLLTIYVAQEQWTSNHFLSMNAANLYVFFREPFLSPVPGYIITGVGAVLFFLTALWKKRKVTTGYIVIMAMFIDYLISFLLPNLHERYIYAAAVLLVVASFFRKELFWAAVLLQAATVMSFMPFLFGGSIAWVQAGAVLNTLTLGVLIYCYLAWSFPQIKKPKKGWWGRMFIWQEDPPELDESN
ncbi:MAG TPA: glycosyltransferase 87 family protein [Longilinea sp.]|nr:glycosyltransferase 87 family protein [Longilinea sp.]